MPPQWGVVATLCTAAPAIMILLLSFALAPPEVRPGRYRLAVIRAALLTGSFAVLTVEVTAACHALTAPVIRGCWLAGVAAAGVAAGLRWRTTRAGPRVDEGLRARWRAATRTGRTLAVALAGLLLGELVMALLAEPNNFDSQTYHLPRIEHWVINGDLEPYPTAIHRQITLAPGAEYLLLHLRLLTGDDSLYHLPQWAAGIGCLLAASRIAAQFGGGRRAQLLTAFLVGTTPMVVMQSTSSQNDLVTAAWTACAATLVLDELARRATADSVLALGAATGLTAVTKNSGLLAVGPLLALWLVAQTRMLAGSDRPVRRAGAPLTAGAGVLAVAALLVGPFIGRTAAEFGHPLGPPRLRESIPMQRHDPPVVIVNALRVGQTALDTPLPWLRRAGAGAVTVVARALGVDPQDRSITFGDTRFPVPAWYPDEDRVAFPIPGTLALLGTAIALVRPRRLVVAGCRVLRAYAVVLLTAGALYAATVKWQPWGNRLLLFLLVLATPLAGLWLDAALRRARSRRPAAAVAAVLSIAMLSAVLSLSYGFPRRFVGAGSVITNGDWETRFLRRPQWADDFRWAARAIQASGADRIGLVQQNDSWEYPWWLLLPDHEIVALQSVLPHRPPADPASVDAVACTGSEAVCRALVPSGWHLEFQGIVGYALPPPG